MVTDSAALVLFAIRSAVKLSQQVRLAVVDATRRRSLELPLPKFFTDTDEIDAAEWFETSEQGGRFLKGYERNGRVFPPDARLAELLRVFNGGNLGVEGKRELVDLHIKYRNVVRAEEGGWSWSEGGGGVVDPDALYSLLTIQQWQRGTDPTPSTLHRVAGTLVEIGIDYALASPDLFDKDSKRGQALYGFLSALDGLDLKETDLAELPARLFVAVLETAGEHPELVSGDLRVQELIKVTTGAVARDVAARLKAIETDPSLRDEIARDRARTRLQDWAQLVFRSTLGSGGRLVLSDPGRFLGVEDEGHGALVTEVGGAMLDLVLVDGGRWGRVVTREGLETMMRAALKVVGEHPQIVGETGNEGLQRLIAGLATDLSKTEDLLSLGVLPEVVRLVLENTGENLELFWPDFANRPENHLLITAAKTTLEVLVRPPQDGEPWRPSFRKAELLQVTEVVIAEVVANPGWLLNKAGALDRTLKDVLEAVLGVLRTHADRRLSMATAVAVLQAALKAAALRPEFLKNLPGNGPVILAALIDAVIQAVFSEAQDSAAAWTLVSAAAIEGLVEVVLRETARHGVVLNRAAVATVAASLDQVVQDLIAGRGFSLPVFALSLQRQLAA